MNEDKITQLVVDLRQKGHSLSEIGMTLRDSYGVPSVKEVTGKGIKDILEENGLASDIPEDLANLIAKAVKLRNHLEIHRKDFHNHRALQITESKIRRLAKYYIREGVLPANWRYERSKSEMLIR